MSIMDQFASQTRFSSLTDLETALFACTACPLRDKAIGPTSYNGNPASPLMLVGE